MNPLIPIAALTAAGVALYKKMKKPAFQSMTTVTSKGVPVKVATPVTPAVTQAQKSGVVARPAPTSRAVPTTVPGKGQVFSPPNTVVPARPTPNSPPIIQSPPIVVTPGGAASVAVGTLKDIQRGLNTLGYAPKLVEDGITGPKTQAAIRWFQQKTSGLVIDGIAGPKTKAALSNALSSMASGASPVANLIAQNDPASGSIVTSSGDSIDTSAALKWGVQNVQAALNTLGASPQLVLDGKIGPKTVAAIKSFQTAHALIADGVAGPKTKTALYLAVAKATSHPIGDYAR